MTHMSLLNNRCILLHEVPLPEGGGDVLYIDLPQARCAGAPSDLPLQLYPLCLDCDLFHQYADRALFSRLAAYIAVAGTDVLDRQSSLDISFAVMHKMLERLSVGDPDARVVLPVDVGLFGELETLLNRVAEFLKEQVDESHEIAIGLCEHYETLLKLAGGDLQVRASTESPVELIAKLGELINSQAETFCHVISCLNAKEQELISLTRLQQGIIDFLPDATFVIDRDHRVIAWNKAMADLSGVSETDMLGKGDYAYSMAFYGELRPLLIDLVNGDLDVARQIYHKVEKRGTTLIAEGSVPAGRYGSERSLWITASPLFDEHGSIVGAIESVRDVTEFRKAETERETLKDQLHHAQKLDSIGQLAGGIAHEFNNILAAILGYAGILEMRLGKESSNLAAVRRIITASEKAASLTRSMLTFSRKQPVSLEPVALNSFISGMQEMLCRLAGENVRIEFHPAPRELMLNADQGQLQQIILNLYNNARDAMPDGGCLTISAAADRVTGHADDLPAGIPPGCYVRLTVADTGSGIAPEEIDRIFDPFFTTKEVGKGTGLGLSMVFGIVQQHKGYIKVTSTPGQGTSFSIWFPETDQACASPPAIVHSRLKREMHGSETILVGEDNECVRPMIVELLQDAGYRVLEACDGSEVVSLMREYGETVNLLLLDVIMPRLNGFEALNVVREQYPGFPCLFLSGYSDDVLKQKANISGEFEYLSKPIMPDELIAAVRTALDAPENGEK